MTQPRNGTLPAGLTPQQLRQLEQWLARPEKPDAPDQWYYVLPLGNAERPADYLVADPHPEFEGAWENMSSSDFATAFGVSRIGRQRKLWIKLAVTGDEGATDSPIFVLPATFRPAKTHRMIVRQGNDGAATVDVNPDGTVVYVSEVAQADAASISALGFLKWGSNTDANSDGLDLDTDSTINLNVSGGSDINLFTEDSGDITLEVDGASGDIFLNTFGASSTIGINSGRRVLIEAATDIDLVAVDDVAISAGDVMTISAGASDSITITAGGQTITISTAGVTARLAAGDAFTVQDSSGNPKLRFTEGSLDLHLPTGGSIVFDL